MLNRICLCLILLIVCAERIPQLKERHISRHSAKEITARLKNLKPGNCTSDPAHCSDNVNAKSQFKKFPHGSRHHRVSATQSLFTASIEITSYTDMLDIRVCASEAENLKEAIVYFQKAERQFNSLELQGQHNNLQSIMSIYKMLCSPMATTATLNNIHKMAEVSTEDQHVLSLVYYFYKNRPKVTNETASACYSTQEFVQNTFEIVYQVEEILTHIAHLHSGHSSRKLINIGLVTNQIRDLKSKQWLHLSSICKKNPSYVVATWNAELPCATQISAFHQPCESPAAIRLFSDRNVLHIGCGMSDFHSDDCGSEERDSHIGIDWYVSTLFVAVADPFHYYICKVALGERFLSIYNHHLLYLNATVCFAENSSTASFATSYTTDLRKHHIIHYPIIFNQGIVGESHPQPFYISGLGLYIDELERLALNMSTFKPLKASLTFNTPMSVRSNSDVQLIVV